MISEKFVVESKKEHKYDCKPHYAQPQVYGNFVILATDDHNLIFPSTELVDDNLVNLVI